MEFYTLLISQEKRLIDINKKLQDLIEPAILEEIQNACALKYKIGLALFDENNNQITASNRNFISDDLYDHTLDFLDVLFHPQFQDSRLEGKLQNGKTVYTSFCTGELLRAVIPVYFMDQLFLKISLIQRAVKENDSKTLIERLKKAFASIDIPEHIFEHTLTEPDSELAFIAENLKNQLLHFLEAAVERSKVLQLNEELLPELVVDDLDKDENNLVFTSPAHVILDATSGITALLGFANTFELTGLNFIESLVLLQEEQQTIIKQLQQSGKLNWYSTILKCSNEQTLHAKIKISPQTLDNLLIGYEYTIIAHNASVLENTSDIEKTESSAASPKEPVVKIAPQTEKSPEPVTENPFLFPETHIAEMFDALPNPVMVLDDKNRISVWNQALENIFKIPAKSILGADISELLLNECRMQWQEMRSKHKADNMNKKLTQNKTLSFLTREGDTVLATLSLSSSKILHKEYTTLVFREWQYQTQGNSLLQQHLHSIINSNLASLITDETGLITTINNAALAWLEMTGEALLNKNIQTLFQEDIGQIINQTIQYTASNSRQFITQLCPEIMDGMMTGLKVSKLESQEQSNHMLLLWEIQDQQSEQNNIVHKAGMNKTQKLEYLISIFPKIVRHFDKISNDLYHNTSSLLLHENMDDEIREHIVKIKKIAQRTATLKQELQYFSRVEKPALEEIDLNEKLQQWADTLRQPVPRHLSLELNLKKNPATILANSRQIKHILKTLIKNAAESYSTSGKIFIHTRLHTVKKDEAADLTEQKAKNFVVLEVIDSGRGIPLNVREQLFEPFVTTKTFELGRGLGLASVYGIVKNHNGYITVKTLEGQGTIFSLFFPLLEKAKTSETRPDKQIADVILLIDDDPGIVEVNSITLKHFGFNTLSANTAEKGIELFRKNLGDINLVILDISLPDMQGTECAEKLLEISAQVPIILSSGYHCDENYYKFMQKTGAVWLQKPYTSNKLYQIIQDLLSKKGK